MLETLSCGDNYYFYLIVIKPKNSGIILILHSLENWIKVQNIHVAQPELKPGLQIPKCALITRTLPLGHSYLHEQS